MRTAGASRRKRTQKPPQRFFERQLAGEEPPTLETMRVLFSRAVELLAAAPWDRMHEDELVVFEIGAQIPCFCSVMGAAGRSMTVQVYIGIESYFWFQKLHGGQPTTIGDFLAHQYSVYVDFANPADITPLERQMAKSLGHPLTAKTVVPVFRTIRRGYHPWYVTEGEARLLAKGMEAVLVVCDIIRKDQHSDLWTEEDVYPRVVCTGEKGDQAEFSVTPMKAPREAQTMPKLPDLDQTRIQSILDRHWPSEGMLEVDQFYGAGMVGARHERKACMRVGLAIDAHTAIAFPPEVSQPERATGELLAEVVLKAVEARRALPAEIHVREPEYRILLDRLAKALGCVLRVRKSLPALDFAKSELQAMLGDPGVIT